MLVKQTVSDLIKVEDIKEWDCGDLIAIKAGTGAGKSYFIMNLLWAIAQAEGTKILYLVNRLNVYDQFKESIIKQNKTNEIHIHLYQSIEAYTLYKKFDTFKKEYKYIVCDEFHYFITDAAYNKTTDISLDNVLNHNDRIRIFMSATGNFILDYLQNVKKFNVKMYEIEYNYDHIERLFFFEKDEVVKKFLSGMKADEKAIYFCHSAKKAYEHSNEFPNSMFVCSVTGNSPYKKHVDKDAKKDMLENERFEEQILFTTSTLDNGVNLNDRQIKYIIVDIEDLDVLIQCLGRKRIQDKNDKITVIIKKMSNQFIGGRITQTNKRMKMADYLKEKGETNFVKKYSRQNSDMIYDVVSEFGEGYHKKVNELMYHKCLYDLNTYNEILENEVGYEEIILELLKKDSFDMLENYYDEYSAKDYLNGISGKKLFKDEQRKFKEWLETNLINAPKKRNGKVGIPTIQKFLEDNDYPFTLDSFKETKGENRDKNYWLITKK